MNADDTYKKAQQGVSANLFCIPDTEHGVLCRFALKTMENSGVVLVGGITTAYFSEDTAVDLIMIGARIVAESHLAAVICLRAAAVLAFIAGAGRPRLPAAITAFFVSSRSWVGDITSAVYAYSTTVRYAVWTLTYLFFTLSSTRARFSCCCWYWRVGGDTWTTTTTACGSAGGNITINLITFTIN